MAAAQFTGAVQSSAGDVTIASGAFSPRTPLSVAALIARGDRRKRNGPVAVEAQQRLARLAHIAELCAIFDAAGARLARVGKFHVDAAALEFFEHGAPPRWPNGRLSIATLRKLDGGAVEIPQRLCADVVRRKPGSFKSGRLRMAGTLFRNRRSPRPLIRGLLLWSAKAGKRTGGIHAGPSLRGLPPRRIHLR